MSAFIDLQSVSVQYKLRTISDLNLKRQAIRYLGRLKRGEQTTLRGLNDISFRLESGSRLAITGANGAGKTTLLRVIAGTLAPTSGTLSISGSVLPLLGGPGATLDLMLTGKENIYQLGLLLGESSKSMAKRFDEIAEFSGLESRLLTPVGSYSNGMIARLRFSIITSLNPQILIIDEGVASSADPEFAKRASERLQDFKNRTEIVVFSSYGSGLHDMANQSLELSRGRSIEHKHVVNEIHNSTQISLDRSGTLIPFNQSSNPFLNDEFTASVSYLHRAEGSLKLASEYGLDISNVLDLGCGAQLLRSILPNESSYNPADIASRSPDTQVVDLNLKQFPQGDYTTTFLLGVSEYLTDLEWVLNKIRKQSKSLIMTYDVRFTREERLSKGWVSHYTHGEISQLLSKSGWEVLDTSKKGFWHIGTSS
jgi:ABC-type polysaccharide/polyol phosphate transport system ATPase subunit